VLVLVASAAMCAGMWFGKSYLTAALTSSAAVQQQLKRVLPLVVATVMLDGQAAVLSGVLRGAGRQGIGAGTSWCSYWLIGLPLAYLLAFKAGMGVLGLRLSLAAAVAVQALVLHVFTACRIDWDEEVRRARDLVAVAGGDGDEDVPAECDHGLLGSGSGLLVVPTQHAQDSSSAALQRPLLANEGLV
jgi:MATE family multidrug resistance protein